MLEVTETAIMATTLLIVLFVLDRSWRKTLISKSHIRLFAKRSESLLAAKCLDLEAQNLALRQRLDRMESMLSAMSMQMGVRIER